MSLALTSFRPGLRAAIFGATGGIGQAFLRSLLALPPGTVSHIDAFARPASLHRLELDALTACSPSSVPTSVRACPLDLSADDASIASSLSVLSSPIDLAIVSTGTLHAFRPPERSYASLDKEHLVHDLSINAVGPALIARSVLPLLRQDDKSAFACLSARVGSITDNRLGGWHAYRASKAALNMLVKTLSIELRRTSPRTVCLALHPGTTDTNLSKPFQKNVRKDKLFSSDFVAQQLLAIIDKAQVDDSGAFIAWDGERLPF